MHMLLPLLLAAPTPASALLCGSFLDPIIVSVSPLAFGNYTAASQTTANTTITVACTIPIDLLLDFTVSLSAGNAGNPSGRYMKHGVSDQLAYNIYTGPGFGTVWGNGADGSVTRGYDGTLALGNIPFTVHGRIPQGQFVAPGPYTDHITVSVAY